MAAVDVLISNAPEAVYFTDMNILYLLLDVNEECYRGQDYSKITIVRTAYEDLNGEPDYSQAVERYSRTYKRYQIVERPEQDMFDPYNIRLGLRNYWYLIEIYFTFQYHASAEGNNTYPSHTLSFLLDNRNIIVYSKKTSSFIYGKLKADLEVPKFNVWVGYSTEELLEINSVSVNDIISNTFGNLFRQIVDIQDDTMQVIPADSTYFNILQHIINHTNFKQSLDDYFKDNIPTPAQLIFQIPYNRKSFEIKFMGDLTNL